MMKSYEPPCGIKDGHPYTFGGTAIELGFADGMIERVPVPAVQPQNTLYSQRTAANRLMNKLTEQSQVIPAVNTTAQPKRTVSDILRHLDTIKSFI